MGNDFYYIELFDLYKELLTEKQKQVFISRFLLDLSYAEIAETEGTSRQSIFDAIKIVKEKLLEFEKALNLKEKYDKINETLQSIDDEKKVKIIKELIGK